MPFEIPVSEMAAAIFFGFLAALHLPMLHAAVLLLFFTFALPLTLIDIRFHRLPHLLTFSAIAVGLVISSKYLGGQGFFLSFSGAVLGFFPVAVVATLYKKGIGMGDAFWLAAIGAFAGPDRLPEVLLIASGTGIVATLSFRTFHNSYRDQPIWGLAIPFGPFLSLGGIVALWNPDSMNNLTIYLK
jgi:leader peptidase (prepilin peptidase)/N-methyltransferase